METVRYTYKLRPSKGVRSALEREMQLAMWVWNQCVETAKYELSKDEKPSPNQMSKYLTEARAKHDWLRAGSSVVQQQTIRNWAAARNLAFKIPGHRHPKVKSRKKDRMSLEYTKRGFSLREMDGYLRLRLAGKLVMPVVWSRELPSEPSSVRVYKDAVGDWWASFVVERDQEEFPEVDAAIGIDWGVKTPATTTSEDFNLESSEPGKRAAKKLANYQRRMARRMPTPGQKASKGYQKAKRDTAKQYRRVARQRLERNRKWARRVVEHHDKIAVEDFKPKFLAKTTMARKAADYGIGQAKQELISYGKRASREIVLVPPAYTTMTCSECGTRTKSRIGLGERIFACDECGLILDRDVNAARVILDAAGFNGAYVENVRRNELTGSSAV